MLMPRLSQICLGKDQSDVVCVGVGEVGQLQVQLAIVINKVNK